MEINWRKNLSNTDRTVRVVIGAVLIGLGVTRTITGWWAAAAIVLGASQFIEAAFAY